MTATSMMEEVGKFEEMGLVWGLKIVKSCSQGALPIHLFRHSGCKMYRLATMHSIAEGRTDRQTDTQTDDNAMPIADQRPGTPCRRM